jgi:hypothetical protein
LPHSDKTNDDANADNGHDQNVLKREKAATA